MANGPRKWLTAAQCAARTGLTVRALRVYERAGLLKPGRAANGWRRYGPDELARLNTISVLRSLGLTLAQIRQLLREAEPPLLNVLRVQAKAWRERRTAAGKAVELVEAAIRRLERDKAPSVEELCRLINALQVRSRVTHDRPTPMTDLMKQLLTPEERQLWQRWWADHPEDAQQNAQFLKAREPGFALLLEQQQRGLAPGDPEVQEQVIRQLALISRYGVRERTVRLMDWNPGVTARFMEIGVIARERHPDLDVMPFPMLGRKMAAYFEQAMLICAPARAMGKVHDRVQKLLKAGVAPTAPSAAAIVKQLADVCLEHDLGDPEIYLRFTPYLMRINHRPLPQPVQQSFEFLLAAVRAHR